MTHPIPSENRGGQELVFHEPVAELIRPGAGIPGLEVSLRGDFPEGFINRGLLTVLATPSNAKTPGPRHDLRRAAPLPRQPNHHYVLDATDPAIANVVMGSGNNPWLIGYTWGADRWMNWAVLEGIQPHLDAGRMPRYERLSIGMHGIPAPEIHVINYASNVIETPRQNHATASRHVSTMVQRTAQRLLRDATRPTRQHPQPGCTIPNIFSKMALRDLYESMRAG